MPKKQTKKKVEESEEEESEQSERSEEESEEKDSDEGSDEGSDKEDDSDEEKSDKSEKSDDDESGSDKDSDDDGSKSGSDDESKSGSDKDSDDEGSDEDSDEDSDDSGKKKKKKKGGKKDKKSDKKGKKGGKDDKKGKKDDKKGKGKEEPEKKVTIVTPISGPTPTLASVIQDLDDLSLELAKTFPAFRPEAHTPIDIKTSSSPFQRNQFEDIRLQSPPTTTYGNGHHYHPPTREEMPMRALRKPYSEPVFNSDYKSGTGTYAEDHKPLHKDRSIQYEAPVVRNPSPEAVRAVNEYKQRREQDKKKEPGLIDRSVGSIHDMVIEPFSTSGNISRKEPKNRTGGSDMQGYERDTMPEIVERDERAERTGRRSQERTEDQDQRDYDYGMSRSRKNFAKSSQLAEDYYGHVRKISTSPQRKTLQDLYKHKPKPMYVESGNKQPVDRYHANSQSYGQQSGQYRIQNSAEKQGTQQNFRQSGSSYKNQNEGGDNKRLINNAMEVLLKKSQNKY